jgi:hypothetical protein
MDENAPAVTLYLLRRYLIANGWNVASSRDAFELFDREGVEVVLPRDRADGSPFARAVNEALRTLSQFEDRAIVAVATDVHGIGYDSVRSRLPDGIMRGGGVSLEIARDFIEGARTLLASTATGELVPTPVFQRARKDAIDYSSRCVFGHTFRGSFGFVIESPVSPNDAPSLLEIETPPFERRVIERLVRGIRDIEQGVTKDSVDEVVGDHLQGFNANMCEDFATLVEQVSPSGLTLEVVFSPEWKPRAGFSAATTFSVDKRHAEVAEEAARRLRKVEVQLNRTITGRVFRLESRANPQEILALQGGGREIAVEYRSDDIGDVRVRIALEPQDYLRALDAHRQGLAVTVSGRLDRIGRNWWLVEHGPVEFVVGKTDGA